MLCCMWRHDQRSGIFNIYRRNMSVSLTLSPGLILTLSLTLPAHHSSSNYLTPPTTVPRMFVKDVPVVHVNYSLPWSDRPTQLNWFWKCSEFLNWPQLWSSPLSFVLSLALRSLLLSRTMYEKFPTFCACRFKYYTGSKIITSLLCGNFCACRRYGFLGLFSSSTIVLARIRSFNWQLLTAAF